MFDKMLKQVHKELLKKKKTVAVAESCSGGLLSCLLTDISGASGYFLLGVVTYSDRSKEIILNISAKTIAKYTAVSSQIAVLMAKNVRKKAKSDFGLSITGIAGPTGSTANKPVGTVFVCLSDKNKNNCRKFSFRGRRQDIRKKSAQEALRLLCARLSL